MLRGSRHAILLLLAAILLQPVATADSANTPPRARAQAVWMRTELYFGTSRPRGQITDAEFRQFVDGEITPRFPAGLTLLTGYGQFRGADGVIVKERSKVLILLYPVQTPESQQHIHYIREEYKRRFQQESVLRVDSLATVSF